MSEFSVEFADIYTCKVFICIYEIQIINHDNVTFIP